METLTRTVPAATGGTTIPVAKQEFGVEMDNRRKKVLSSE